MQAWEEIAYARQEGYDIGYAVGFLRELIAVICKKLTKGKSVEQIADELEQRMECIFPICHVAEKYAPDYDQDAIYQEMVIDV